VSSVFCVGSSHAPSPYCGQFTWPDMVALRSGETVRDEDEARCPVFAGVDPAIRRSRTRPRPQPGPAPGTANAVGAKQRRVRDLLVAGTGIVKTARIVGCGVYAVRLCRAAAKGYNRGGRTEPVSRHRDAGAVRASTPDGVQVAPWLACTFPCRRFADILADPCARLGADVGRYPSSQWTCTTYSLPVSRRTRVRTQAFNLRVESPS
jgi:hypothetical protein